MAGVCKIILIGHVGRDPEIRYTQDGLAVANFSVAVNEKVKGEEKTEWFRIVAFGKLGETCGQYITKGKQVYVEGRLRTDEWQDREGNKRVTLEVIANQVMMLGTKGDALDIPSSSPPMPSARVPSPPSDPEIPPRPVGSAVPITDTPASSPDEDDIPF